MTAAIKYNSAREGIELHFKEGKPDEDVLAHIKAMGYQKAKRGFWYVTDSPELRTFTEQLVKAMDNKKPFPEITRQPSFEANEANLEDRNFSFVSIYLKDNGKKEFILFEPAKNLAEGIAGIFAKKKFGDKVKKVNVYPKSRIKEARLLFNQGNIIGKVEKEEKPKNYDNSYLNEIRSLLIKEANAIQSFIVNHLKGMKKSVVAQREKKNKEIDNWRTLAEKTDEQLLELIEKGMVPEKIIKEASKYIGKSDDDQSEQNPESNNPSSEENEITPALNSNLPSEALKQALWTEKDNEYPVNKIIVLGKEYDQARLRETLQDELAKLSIDKQLAIGQAFSEKYKPRRSLSEYEKGLVTIGKSGDKRKAIVLSSFIDDIFLDHGILDKQPAVFEYFIGLLFGQQKSYLSNIIIPTGVREPFASGELSFVELREKIQDYPDLLEINEKNLSEAKPEQLFELVQMAHPNEYGIEVSRSAMLEEWEKTGAGLFEKLGLPTDDLYPYVNIHTGYKSVYPLAKELQHFGGAEDHKKWWAVAEHMRPIADIEKALTDIDNEIASLKEKKKELVNSKTGKPKGEKKDAVSSIEFEIESLKKSKEVIDNYIKNKKTDTMQKTDYTGFLEEVTGLVKKHFSLDISDIDGSQIKTAFEKKESPLEFVKWWGEKYELEPTKPFTEETKESPVKKKATQYDLNKEIESFIDKKDRTGDSFSQEDKNYIVQYTGSGGLIKQGAKDKGILYEYYTPDEIVKKMWELAYKFGYHNGSVLEPSCGTGRFLKYAPENIKVTGLEINHFAKRIAEVLYPFAEIRQQPFESFFFKGNIHHKQGVDDFRYDLVIGNPPYGEFSGKYAGMGEKKYTGAKTYDQYFITRGLDLLTPGGLLVFIIPSSFLDNDSTYNKIKENIALKADLIDAYRLPTSLFETTDIGTDIVIFKKK